MTITSPLRLRRPGFRLTKIDTTQASPLSPPDSGYGSVDDSSTEESPVRVVRYPISLDGPGSEDDSDSLDEDTVTAILRRSSFSRSPRRFRSVSAPSRAHDPVRVDPVRTSIRKEQRPSGHARAPDRFVPFRDHVARTAERYRTTKPVHTLSTSERLLRDDIASSDPFMPRRGPPNSPVSSYTYSSTTRGQNRQPGFLPLSHSSRAN